MTVRSAIAAIFQQEELNFLLTNRIPRRLLTQLVGWFSQIEQPLVRDLSIGVWRFFSARSTAANERRACPHPIKKRISERAECVHQHQQKRENTPTSSPWRYGAFRKPSI